ncbi:uncharacterized protein LOC114526791 [Dendronephthya gigantea]|uniref:uncharacterized protein LOC114526791 n=1 Tax=Dendronephthya gigantea TaxID=151771 RepID=UPI00106C805C|nr:uncharacterized protein LOC114526791 [Dendronephthya gigantea]
MVGYTPVTFKVPDTWTHDVCILGRCDESTTPDRSRSEALTQAGLGRVRIVFPNRKASHADLQNFLESKFPKLKAGGGFEVLRAHGGGGGQRSLVLILPSNEGYTVPYLKERLNSAVAYIRPFQADLDESSSCEMEVGPMVPCIHCNKEMPFSKVKEHNCISESVDSQFQHHDEDAVVVDGPSSASHTPSPSNSTEQANGSDIQQIEADQQLARRLDEELNDVNFDDDLEILNTSISNVPTSLAKELAVAALKSGCSEPIGLYVQRSRVLKNVFEELKDQKFETSQSLLGNLQQIQVVLQGRCFLLPLNKRLIPE